MLLARSLYNKLIGGSKIGYITVEMSPEEKMLARYA